MEELQLIYSILKNKSLEPFFFNELEAKFFTTHKKIIEFILSFNMETSSIPSLETVSTEFPGLEWPDDEENPGYLAKQIKENYVFSTALEIINNNEKTLKENSFEGVSKIELALHELLKINATNYETLLERETIEDSTNVSYITTGFELLDAQIGGYRSKDELITIAARTRTGKSWILLKTLLMNWKAGKNVGLYSGEMNRKDIADRFDALNLNISNKNIAEGFYDKDSTFKEYKKSLGDSDNKFILQTFKGLGRRATVRDIEAMIVKHKLEVIGIDQLSLMTDIRYNRGDTTRQTYDNISMDLFHLAEKYNIVIILLVQLNREGAKNDFPTLENIAESDSIAQNSSKVLALHRDEKNGILTIRTLKNRYGTTGKDVKYVWDIDLGLFTPVVSNSVEVMEGSDDIFL